MKTSAWSWGAGLLLTAFLSAGPAHAQLARTWIASFGVDTNPCTRALPCRSPSHAAGTTAAGGEINCIDPADFNGFVISHSLTIDCAGTFGGTINVPFVWRIDGTGAVVKLRNLTMSGNGTIVGGNAIEMMRGSTLFVENCRITNFR